MQNQNNAQVKVLNGAQAQMQVNENLDASKKFGNPTLVATYCVAILILLGITGCEKVTVLRQYDANGNLACEVGVKELKPAHQPVANLLANSENKRILHGMVTTWREDGTRETLRIFMNGVQQGYAFKWNAEGKLVDLEHWTDGLRDWSGPPTEIAPTNLAQR